MPTLTLTSHLGQNDDPPFSLTIHKILLNSDEEEIKQASPGSTNHDIYFFMTFAGISD